MLLAGKTAVESAVYSNSPQPLPPYLEAQKLRRLGCRGDGVRMALGMEEGFGRRRRKLKIVKNGGDYWNAREARDAPEDIYTPQAQEVASRADDGTVDRADAVSASTEKVASELHSSFAASKRKPSISACVPLFNSLLSACSRAFEFHD
jgi:hypothetical protein